MAAAATALRAPPAPAAQNVAIDIRGVSHAFDLRGSRLPVLDSIDLTSRPASSSRCSDRRDAASRRCCG